MILLKNWLYTDEVSFFVCLFDNVSLYKYLDNGETKVLVEICVRSNIQNENLPKT